MQMNLAFDNSVGNLSAADQIAFEAAMLAAASALDGIISNNITVTIAVGYGEVGGYGGNTGSLVSGGNELAGGAPIGHYYLYGPLRTGLQNSSNLAAVNAAFAALPATEPVQLGSGTANLYTSDAEAKALGVIAADSVEIDGDLGVSDSQSFDYDTTGAAVPAGEYSLVGVAEHELTHALGRYSSTPTNYTPLDLFRYASPGTLAGVGGTPAYFSLDNGTTDINNYDTASDYSDWLGTINGVATLDSFNAFETPGTLLPITMSDRLELGALGFDINLGLISWTGAVNTDYNNAGNWDALQVPGDTDDVGIISAATVSVDNVQTTTVDSLQIVPTGTLQIDAGHFLITDGAENSANAGEIDVDASGIQVTLFLEGTFENAGVLQLFGPDADLQTNDSTVTVSGSGTIDMVRGNIGGRTSDSTGADTFVSSNLIRGSGIIGLDGFLDRLDFDNKGTVQADDVLPLTINGIVVNDGLLTATSKLAALVLTGTVDNTGGQIIARDGATVELSNVTVTGGQINTVGTGKIEVSDNSKLDGTNLQSDSGAAGLTINGDIVVDDGASLSLTGAVSGGMIDATEGAVLLSGASLSGVTLKGNIGFGGGGNTIYAAPFFSDDEIYIPTDITGLKVGAGGGVTLAPALDGHGEDENGFINSGVFSLSGKNAFLGVFEGVAISGGGTISMGDSTDVIAGSPGGGPDQGFSALYNFDNTIEGQGLITGLQLENLATGTIMASGGTLILDSGTDHIFEGGNPVEDETVSDGWLGAAANSDLVIMGQLDLQANIIDGSSPGGSFSGAGTITLGGSIVTGARAGTIVGGIIEAGRTIQVVAPGGGLESVTVDGEVDVNGGALLTLYGGQGIGVDFSGTLNNAGLIVLNGSVDGDNVYQAATLAPVGDMEVRGGGTIRLESDGATGSDRIVSITNDDTLENTGDTIEGVGALGGSYLNMINDSTIAANVNGGALTVDGGSLNGTAGLIYNNGLMEATGGGTLAIDSAVFNYGIFFEFEGPAGAPVGGGDIGASGPGSVIDLNGGAITGGRLWTENGGLIEVTGNSTIGGGSVLVPTPETSMFGDTAGVVNDTTTGPQGNGAVAGLASGRIVVAWDDYGVTTNGSPTTDPATGAVRYPPVVRFAVLDSSGTKLTNADLTVQSAPSGTSQSDPEVAALTNGGFVITWLQSDAGGGAITLRGVTYNADLSVAGGGFSIPVSGSGIAAQDVAGMKDGGFAVVWADAASSIHLQRFSKTGLGGTVVDLGSGVAPTIALAGNGSGAYAVTWLVPGAGGEGTVRAQFFNAAGVAAGAPVTVGTGDSPHIAPGQNGNAFIVLWNDPVNQPGVPQGQEFQANGQLSGIGINTAAELDYGGLFTASSAALKDGRVATVQSQPRDGSTANTDVGLLFSATKPNVDEFVSYANIGVAAGQTLTLREGMFNAGTIALPGGAGAVLSVSGLVDLEGPGSVTLGGAADAISGATGSDTLDFEGSSILGQGTIGGNNLSFENSGTVNATGGTLVVGTGGGTLKNLVLMKASGGTLVIDGPVTNEGIIESTNSAGFGEVVINGPVVDQGFFTGFLEVVGGEMVLGGSVGVTQNVFFSATQPGTLVLADPLEMRGTIDFLSLGNTIDVAGVAATGFSYDPSNGTLDLLSGASTLAVINLQGVSSLGSLTVSSDNHGGTLVELVPASEIGFGANVSVAGLPGGGFVEIYQPFPFDDSPPTGVYATIFNERQSAVAQSQVDPSGQQPAVAAQRDGQFMVVWVNATTNTIQGRIYDADGTLIKETFDLTQPVAGWTQINPSIAVDASSGRYEFAYETDNASTGMTSVVAQTLGGNGVATAPPTVVTSFNLDVLGVSYAITDPRTPRAVAQKLSSPLQVEVFASMAQSPSESTAFQAVVGEFVAGGGSSGDLIAGSASGAVPVATKDLNTMTIMFTPPDSDLTYVAPEIVALANGDLVAVWDQIGPADPTWTVAGQIVTSAGVFVGSQFTIATALPAAATPDRPAIDALPNGAFVVTYNSAAGSLSGQKYDTSGNPVGDPFGVTNASDSNPATTVLSDGMLLTVSGDSGNVSAAKFSVQGAGATWSGASGTDLGTAGNWQPVALPDATETLTFNTASGGTLTGTVSGMNAVFSGTGAWLLQGATVALAGETLSPNAILALKDNAAVTVTGGSFAATGSLDIEAASDATMKVQNGAQVSAQGISLGGGGGEGGVLAVSGLGTAIQNTGTHGSIEIGGSGSGQVSIAGGAQVTNAAGATLGVDAGGGGLLTLSGAGSQFGVTGELDVGVAGSGHLNIENQATVTSGNSAASPSEGLDIAELPGGSGEATVTGVNSLLSNAGRFIVGDAGLGGLSVAAGASVTTTADAIIANTSDASGSSVNVTGAGSNLTVAGTLIVGASGSGALSLSQGATVTASSLDVAVGATGDGSVSLVGAGTTLTVTGDLTLGDQAAGELSILGGARMTIAGGLVGGLSGAGGNLDIEGTGSQLTINGGTLVVGENGPAEFTLGIGATLKGEVATDLFGITNEFGDVDPATDPNDGTLNVGNSQGGSSQEYDFFVANSGTINIKGTATFYTPLVTFETGAQDLSINGLWVIGAKDTLVMNATSVDASQAFDFASAAGAALVIGRVPGADVTNLDTLDGQTMPTLTGSIAPGAANVLAGWAAPIENYASGDAITLAGLAYGSATASGDVVTMWPGAAGQGTPRGSLTFLDKNGNPSNAQAALAATQINALACFVTGTRIGTDSGLVAVEDLAVGDRVRTVDGGCEPVVWVGSRAVDCARHPRPETVWPVCVTAGAFGENVPGRDLYLSPDHAVFVNDVLVPVKLLVNGSSIKQVKRNHVAYHHVELPEHAVILAEGLAVESYLDIGDRANFTAGGTIRLYPDFAARLEPNAARLWETKGAARLVMAGEELEAARAAVISTAPTRLSRSMA